MRNLFAGRVRRGTHAGLILACGLAAMGLAWTLNQIAPGLLEPVELWSMDLRFRARPALAVSSDRTRVTSDTIIVIDYDDQAARDYALGRWPWDRRVHAQMIEWLRVGGTRVILFDLLFDRPSAAPVADAAFIAAVQHAGTVLFPAVFHAIPENQPAALPAAGLRHLLSASGSDTRALPPAGDIVWPLPALLDTAAGLGHIQRTPDVDGALRRLPLLYKAGDRLFPSLGFAAALRYLDADPASVRIEPGQAITFAAHDGRTVAIPIDFRGRAWVNYAGAWGQRFTHYPYSWLRRQIESQDGRGRLGEWFQGKIVVLANLTTGSSDQGPTPFERDFPFSEMHAHAINMMITGQFLREATQAEAMACLMLPAALLAASALLGGPGWILPAYAALLLGYGTVLNWAFRSGVILPALQPLLALTLAVLLLVTARWLIVDQERLKFLSVLGAVLPPHTIEAIRQSPDRIPRLLAGRQRELSLLFADVQGFTDFCERAEPMEIQRVLRECREALTDILLRSGGTLEKYTGDEVMAFFGDAEPEDGGPEQEEARVERQAANAVRAGLAIQQEMRALNDRWQRQGRAAHAVRVGIHTGMVAVGNFGTEQLWDYGVVGAEVNKAKRIEGAAPAGGLMLSKRTYALARQHGVLAEDLPNTTVSLKGIPGKVELYEVSPEVIVRLPEDPDLSRR